MASFKKYLPLALMAVIIIAVWFSGLGNYISIDYFQNNKGYFERLVADYYIPSLVVFSALYIVVTATSFPVASFLTIFGGYLFGVAVAAPLVAVSATIGATIIFLIAKTSFGGFLRQKVRKFYDRVEGEMKNNAFFYLLSVRIVPIFPFFIVNVLPALFNMKTREYVAATFFGILPGTIIYANLGRSLNEIEKPSDLISIDLFLSLALLAGIALLPVLIRKYRGRKLKGA